MPSRSGPRPRPALIGEEIHTPERGRPCPICGKPAHNTNRKTMDRVVSLVVPMRRWKCTSCGWTGIKASRRGLRKRREWFKTYGWIVLTAGLLLVFLTAVIWLISRA